MNCEVCGAVDRTCGHTELRLPVVDLAPHNGGTMGPRERPTRVRQAVPSNRGRPGWRNALITEPGTEGIPIAPEPDDLVEAAALVLPADPTGPRALERRPKGRARPAPEKE